MDMAEFEVFIFESPEPHGFFDLFILGYVVVSWFYVLRQHYSKWTGGNLPHGQTS